jgi:hypothetical protein
VRRLFWLALGIAVGALAARRLTRFTRAWTPGGIADQAAGLGGVVRDLADEVRDAAYEREAQLRGALGVTGPGDPDAPYEAAGPGRWRTGGPGRDGRKHFDVDHSDQDKDGH